jgi:hypothetical protein
MANTYADYTGDGSNTDFAITFDYIKTSHVAVEINDGPAGGTNKWVRKTLTSDYTVVTSPAKKVVFNSAPANLVKVRVLRDSDANTGIVDFANGSVLTETELDNSYQHNRYLAEEAEEGKTGGALVKDETSGQFDADALRLENLADPDSDDDAVNKGYADARYVDVAGDTMTGALNLVDPTADDHAAKKKYVDDQDALQVTKSGDTMSGELNMGSNKITNLGTPTSSLDAATKDYVDDTITTSFATGSPPPGNEIGTSAIEDDAVTYAKLQNVAANNVLLGNDNGAGVDVQELTATEARTLLNVEDGATANDTDANLKDRANHTGTQTAATISDFDTEVANNSAVTANTAKVSNATHTGDVTGSTALTLATVNSDVGDFTNANITVNGKGLITAASNGSGDEYVSSQGTGTTTATTTTTDEIVGSVSLTLPSGKTWKWVKVVFSTELASQDGITQVKVRETGSGSFLSWVSSFNGRALLTNNSDDESHPTFIFEGVPSTTGSNITIEVTGRAVSGFGVDVVASRELYAVGIAS